MVTGNQGPVSAAAQLANTLAAIKAAAGDTRARLENDFLTYQQPLFLRIAHLNRNRPGVNWEADKDDLAALVATTAMRMLSQVATAEAVEPHRWERELFTRAAREIRQWTESAEVTGRGGMTGYMRRARGLHMAKQRLWGTLGYEPTDDQLLAYYNAHIEETRSDAAKQGALATHADLVSHVLVRIDPADMQEMFSSAIQGVGTDNCPLDPTEAPTIIQVVIETCERQGGQLAQVARVWFSWYPAGEKLSDAEVKRRVNMAPSTVARCIWKIRQIAIDALAEHGIGDSPPGGLSGLGLPGEVAVGDD